MNDASEIKSQTKRTELKKKRETAKRGSETKSSITHACDSAQIWKVYAEIRELNVFSLHANVSSFKLISHFSLDFLNMLSCF